VSAWADSLTGHGFRAWLLELVPPRKALHMSFGQTLDPFGTSWRTLSTQAAHWLPDIRDGVTQPGVRRQPQATTDLRSAELLRDEGPALSSLGAEVLERWEHRPMPTTFEYELPRAVALLEAAIEHRALGYLERLAFWWDIRSLYYVDELLADEATMLLLAYLNQTRAGFNPWAVLLGSRHTIRSPFDWEAIKSSISERSADTDRAVDALAGKTHDRRPFAARVVFCRAMEMVFMSRFSVERVKPHLEALELPARR
jgi:hypothetical protein